MDPASSVALIVGLLALIGVIAQIHVTDQAARRDAWWARVQWALERVNSSEEDVRVMALLMVERLARQSSLASDEDRAMLEEVVAPLLTGGS